MIIKLEVDLQIIEEKVTGVEDFKRFHFKIREEAQTIYNLNADQKCVDIAPNASNLQNIAPLMRKLLPYAYGDGEWHSFHESVYQYPQQFIKFVNGIYGTIAVTIDGATNTFPINATAANNNGTLTLKNILDDVLLAMPINATAQPTSTTRQTLRV